VEKDAHGNVQLSGTGALADLLREEIRSKLGIKRVRGDTFGYLQRSFAGCASDVDRREAREVGEFAVKQAIWGAGNGSVAIRRIGDYSVDYALVKLAKVGGKTKVMALAVAWQFFKDHPFKAGKPDAYAKGLPSGFPSYCKIQ